MTRDEAIFAMEYFKLHFAKKQQAVEAFDMAIKALEEQEKKTGRWIPTGYDGYADGKPVYDWWECSECGWEHTGDEESLTAFCPNCGVKMESEE